MILSGSDGHWYIARHRGSDSRDFTGQTVATAPRKMEVRGRGEDPVDAPAQRRLPPRLPPQALQVVVPSCQTSCSGMYMLVPNEQPNGHPLWRQKAMERVHWLFCSPSGRWCVGGADVQRECFSRVAGYVAQTRPSGPDVFPHECETLWQLWDRDNKQFREESAIQVTKADQTSLDPTKPWSISAGHNHVVAADQPSFPLLEKSLLEITDCPAQNQGPGKCDVSNTSICNPVVSEVFMWIPCVLCDPSAELEAQLQSATPTQCSFERSSTDCPAKNQGLDRNSNCKDNEVPPVIGANWAVAPNVPDIVYC